MREIQYRSFSLQIHKKSYLLNKLSVCQFELTFKCGLHCRHCYTDCYNKPTYFKKELNTEEVKFILDKVYQAGVIWLCFTGGDPLVKDDFLEIYSYAKDKGFIVTIFTNAYSITKEIANCFKKSPPFVIEMTLNAVTEELYEKISQVKGSFDKIKQGIDLVLKAKLPLKIKTQVIKDNLEELPRIKKFIQGLGLSFRPSLDLHARLNGDLFPCNLRVSPKEIFGLNGNGSAKDNDCRLTTESREERANVNLFHCAIGGDGIHIDPYGNTFLCNLIRKPAFNLLKIDIDDTLNKLLPLARNRKFTTDSKCRNCNLRESCNSCPGRAFIESGDMEVPIEYYCQLAKATSG